MIEFDFNAATARQRLREAEIELSQAQVLLEQDCGSIVGIALLNRIRIAARQVDRAREIVERADPDCPECRKSERR